MKIYHVFYKEDGKEYRDTVVALSHLEALGHVIDERGKDCPITRNVEVPEKTWDDHKITFYEDNNTDNEPFTLTYREEVSSVGLPYTLCSTNPDFLD